MAQANSSTTKALRRRASKSTMKEDAPTPTHPPKKRHQLERVPDLWLAVWANDSELPESERQRAQDERDRRRTLSPSDYVLGLLVDREDCTPVQLTALREVMAGAKLAGAKELHHPWTTRRIAGVCRHSGLPITTHQNLRDVVLASERIIVAPRGPDDFKKRTPAWESVQYAKHRKLPVTVVMPDGTVEGG